MVHWLSNPGKLENEQKSSLLIIWATQRLSEKNNFLGKVSHSLLDRDTIKKEGRISGPVGRAIHEKPPLIT